MHYTAKFRTHPPPHAAGTVYFDDPAPQMVGQLLKLAQFFDTPLPDPEQVIEVPKILSDDVPMRTPAREPQLVEQLVEVPTIVSWSLLQLITKQNVHVPVPGRGVRISGLQGFPRGQSSTALPSKERISERSVEQIIDFTVGGGLQDFRPGQSSFASSSSPGGVHGSADGPREWVFFALFPERESAKIGPHSGSELSADFTYPPRQLMWTRWRWWSFLTTSSSSLARFGEMDRRSEHVRQGFRRTAKGFTEASSSTTWGLGR